MTKVVRAFPLLPGREAELQEFIDSMDERSEEVNAFYERYGVHSETWHVQTTPEGTLVIVTTELENEEAFADYAHAKNDFDRWFKNEVRRVSGVDLDATPRGAPSVEAFSWTHPHNDNC